ncbi:RNA 3'-terminal phosphate cyclase [Halobacteria archaeon AArc-curdl1]|uniref:RNA 3'-terminal phosphate cyclase n=1 Tax=Natronosalvus hydrolyticus TaxID=2979988 RepID=A0AAP2Z6K9_9EURY|nr:RNA 3'-terminal phosphate cyclase [Halobacteria archaeon AArc-curdl1]
MHTLDGSDAGGQFLRRTLTLSALENEPVRLEHIRGDRPTPGLANQHLAAVETMADVCDADVTGAERESQTVEFDPSTTSGISGGEYHVSVGTAGSLTLLFDTLLSLAARLEAPLAVTATGGTDVKWSPSVDYFRRVKLPLLRRHGLQAALEVERRGFYPAGGGRLRLQVAPSTFQPLSLERRGPLTGIAVFSTEADSLADANVAERQAGGALERLQLSSRWSEEDGNGDDTVPIRERVETTAQTRCPGSVIVIALEFAVGSAAEKSSSTTDHFWPLAGASALGEPGKPAERVGEEAADEALELLETPGTVDRYLGDQLLEHLAIGGGQLRIPDPTAHVETSLRLLEAFDYNIDSKETDDGSVHLDAAGTPFR